jgi:DNA-directed RNA polymerase specialized sigma24 family protein
MSSDGSVTHFLRPLKDGDRDAAQPLWEAYFARLVGPARVRLRRLPRADGEDEEDVALSVFGSFCRRAESGGFFTLDDRQGFWQLLVILTVRKALAQARRARRLKRGAGKVVTFADLDDPYLGAVLGTEPTPARVAQVAEERQLLLACSEGEALRQVALWKLEGFTNREIDARLGCVEKTVACKLKSIRQMWSDSGDANS